MLELLTSQPRMALGAVGGATVGFLGAVILRTVFPELSALVGAILVAVTLALGVWLGGVWEGRSP